MAAKKKKKGDNAGVGLADFESDDFTATLIKQINKEHNEKIAFNLGSSDDAGTNIKRWISTGSRQLDCIISNKNIGGFPEGRIVEIQGPPSSGKSHIAFEVAKATQKMGGIVVYLDTENATSLENLEEIGINVHNRFVFVQTGCTEEVFAVAESTILKARAMTKQVPVTIIWDSVAATAPKAELEGDYEQQTIGLQARVIGRGLRKITQIIGNQNVLFLLINQQRKKIGVTFGDDTTTPGGMAIPYSSSTRIRITSTGQNHVKNKHGDVVGINVKAKTIKNKAARPFRSVEFQIIFGVGVVEHEQVFDAFRAKISEDGAMKFNGKEYLVEGTGAWKSFIITNEHGIVDEEIKFHKSDFGEKVLYDPKYSEIMDAMFEYTFVMTSSKHKTYSGVDSESYTDNAALLLDAAEAELRSEGKL